MGFQGIEIVEATALLVVVVALVWPFLRPWRIGHPSSFWPVVVVLGGLTAGLLAVILNADAFPDEFEPMGRTVLLFGLVGGGVLLAMRNLFSP